ncbi:MAG TPA: hypothetical protein PKD78_03985 [Saprospiraceae bacterium]|nr:hypothetical protein [Saprospiraceae bacterium]HNG90077.1 hypothetical protein [Saprospiraceae bacterium]
MFEHRRQPLLTRPQFYQRMLRFTAFSLLLIGLSLLMGMAGYRHFAHVGWTEAFYNASMILTGMGPALDIAALPEAQRSPVQVFAGCYAIYSGVVFLAAAGLVFSPLLHRVFHRFHLEMED